MDNLFLGEYVIDISADGIIDIPNNFKKKLSETKYYFVNKDDNQEILTFFFDSKEEIYNKKKKEKYLYNGKEPVVPLKYRKMFIGECYLIGSLSKIELYNKKSKEEFDLFFDDIQSELQWE